MTYNMNENFISIPSSEFDNNRFYQLVRAEFPLPPMT